MKKLTAIFLCMFMLVALTACRAEAASDGGYILAGYSHSDDADSLQSGNPLDNDAISDSPLVGTWYGIESGFHGNAGYYWSFGKDGRFAYLFSGYEPPQGGGSIESSVRERFMQGKFRVNGSTIECYDIKADDFFARGDNWKYFPERDPALLANILLATPLIKPENVDDFSFDFEFTSAMNLRLVVDRGDFPDQYDMDFEYVE